MLKAFLEGMKTGIKGSALVYIGVLLIKDGIKILTE